MSKLFDDQVAAMKKEHKTFRLIQREDSLLMKVIYYTLLMFLWNKRFLTDYTTVIFSQVYMPKRSIGTDSGYLTLRHENVHIRDCWHWWIIPFAVSYIFLLPAVFTCRSVWEKRGYAETIRAYYELYHVIPDRLLLSIEEEFTGSAYLWMCPFKKHIRAWLQEVKSDILANQRRK